MYKLLFSIIIFSAGFSFIAEAQNANNSATTKLLLNENTKHFTNTSTKDTVVVYKYKSLNKVSHNRINTNTPSLQYYRIPEKTERDITKQSHKKTIPNSKLPHLKYVPIKKDRDSLKVKKQILVKDY